MGCDKSAMLKWPRFGIKRKDWEREMGWGCARGNARGELEGWMEGAFEQ